MFVDGHVLILLPVLDVLRRLLCCSLMLPVCGAGTTPRGGSYSGLTRTLTRRPALFPPETTEGTNMRRGGIRNPVEPRLADWKRLGACKIRLASSSLSLPRSIQPVGPHRAAWLCPRGPAHGALLLYRMIAYRTAGDWKNVATVY